MSLAIGANNYLFKNLPDLALGKYMYDNFGRQYICSNRLSEQERRRQFLHSFHARGLPCLDRIQGAIKLCVMFS